MSDTLTLPVLPLRATVMFPGVTAPIRAGRPGTLKAIEAAVAAESKLVFAVAQRDDASEVSSESLYTIGTIARVGHLQQGRNMVQLLLEGDQRGIAFRISQRDGYLEAVVRPAEEMEPSDAADAAYLALYRELRDRAAELGRKAGLPEEMVAQILDATDEGGRLADLVASYLEIEPADRQALLETLSVEERLRRVLVHVQRQIGVLDAQESIKNQVQQELGDRQREMVLREQLKAIRRELGEGDDAEEVDELRETLDALELPEAARKEVDRELKRLGRMNRESMEYQVLRNYLEVVAELPWNERSEEHLDLPRASSVLDRDHYGLQDVKDRVLEYLAVHQLRRRETPAKTGSVRKANFESELEGDPEVEEVSAADSGDSADVDADAEIRHGAAHEEPKQAPILLFAGPPGVGKTSIARSIARAMGREYVRISLGGARDEADIRGHRRTYVGAMPGRILKGMKQAGTRNPVFLLDEVDKLGASYQGDPAAALLEVLDPAQNDSFVDHYLGVPFDLSEVLFIATANYLQNIPGPLLDRMELVEFSGYTENEKLEIAKRYLVPRQRRQQALEASEIQLADEALSEVVTHYTREAGVRQLEREIGRLCRKVARRIAAGDDERVEVDRERVRELLGRPKIHPETAASVDQVGVATGMFYTPVGGDILFVEVTTMPGKGNLVLTGQLGDVMKESAHAAWSYARSRAGELGWELEAEPSSGRDVHIHVPAGAVPKDGPSAGVTMATALTSALTGRPARHDLAMTGEITLSGRVLPIGGVKEKVLGAVRAGLREVLLPKANVPDLEDVPAEVRRTLTIHPVERLDEVLALAIPGLGPVADGGSHMGRGESDRARPVEH